MQGLSGTKVSGTQLIEQKNGYYLIAGIIIKCDVSVEEHMHVFLGIVENCNTIEGIYCYDAYEGTFQHGACRCRCDVFHWATVNRRLRQYDNGS